MTLVGGELERESQVKRKPVERDKWNGPSKRERAREDLEMKRSGREMFEKGR